MSNEKIERILATYEPVDGKPGYVWFSKANFQVVKIEVLREVMEELLGKDGNNGRNSIERDCYSA